MLTIADNDKLFSLIGSKKRGFNESFIASSSRGTKLVAIWGQAQVSSAIGSTSLIKYSVDLLLSRGITEIGVALGYQGDDIRSELKGYDVEFFTNPFYDITNSIVSIWFAKQFMTGIEDILIMNADVYLEKNTLESIMKSKLERVVFADSDRTIDADYKLKYTGSTLLVCGKFGRYDISGEYIGTEAKWHVCQI